MSTFPPAAVIDGVTAAVATVMAKLVEAKRVPSRTDSSNSFLSFVFIASYSFWDDICEKAHGVVDRNFGSNSLKCKVAMSNTEGQTALLFLPRQSRRAST